MKDNGTGAESGEKREKAQRSPTANGVRAESNEHRPRSRSGNAGGQNTANRNGRESATVQEHAENHAQQSDTKRTQPCCCVDQRQIPARVCLTDWVQVRIIHRPCGKLLTTQYSL